MKRLLALIACMAIVISGCGTASGTTADNRAVLDTQVSNNFPDTPEEVWGELEQYEGGHVWDTLTAEQRAMVHYPKFNPGMVYWTPNGKSYHAINWCYTLSRAKTIQSGTLEEAREAGKSDPCSKCVG